MNQPNSLSTFLRIERYGVLIGRLWMRWPYIEPRDLWVGVYAPERYWEGGKRFQRVYVCLVPMVVLSFDWRLRGVE